MPKKQPLTQIKQKIINQIKKKIRKRLKELAFEDNHVDENWQVLYKKLTEDFYTPGNEIKIGSVDYDKRTAIKEEIEK